MNRRKTLSFIIWTVIGFTGLWMMTEPLGGRKSVDQDLLNIPFQKGQWQPAILLNEGQAVLYPLEKNDLELCLLTNHEVGSDPELYSLRVTPLGPNTTPLTLWEQAMDDGGEAISVRTTLRKTPDPLENEESILTPDTIRPNSDMNWASTRKTYIRVDDFIQKGATDVRIEILAPRSENRTLVRAFREKGNAIGKWSPLNSGKTNGKGVELEITSGERISTTGTIAWPGRAAALNVVGPAGLTVEITPSKGSEKPKLIVRILKLTERGLESSRDITFDREKVSGVGGLFAAEQILDGPATILVEPLNFEARMQFRLDSLLLLDGRPVCEVVSRVRGKWADVRPMVSAIDLYDTYVDTSEMSKADVVIPVVSPKPNQATSVRITARVPVLADDSGPVQIQLFHRLVGGSGIVISEGPLTAAVFPSRTDYWLGSGPKGLRISKPIHFEIKCPVSARNLQLWSDNHVMVEAHAQAKPKTRVLFVPEEMPSLGLSRSDTREGHRFSSSWWAVLPEEEHKLRAKEKVRTAAVSPILYEPNRDLERMTWIDVQRSGFTATPILRQGKAVRALFEIEGTPQTHDRLGKRGEKLFWNVDGDLKTLINIRRHPLNPSRPAPLKVIARKTRRGGTPIQLQVGLDDLPVVRTNILKSVVQIDHQPVEPGLREFHATSGGRFQSGQLSVFVNHPLEKPSRPWSLLDCHSFTSKKPLEVEVLKEGTYPFRIEAILAYDLNLSKPTRFAVRVEIFREKGKPIASQVFDIRCDDVPNGPFSLDGAPLSRPRQITLSAPSNIKPGPLRVRFTLTRPSGGRVLATVKALDFAPARVGRGRVVRLFTPGPDHLRVGLGDDPFIRDLGYRDFRVRIHPLMKSENYSVASPVLSMPGGTGRHFSNLSLPSGIHAHEVKYPGGILIPIHLAVTHPERSWERRQEIRPIRKWRLYSRLKEGAQIAFYVLPKWNTGRKLVISGCTPCPDDVPRKGTLRLTFSDERGNPVFRTVLPLRMTPSSDAWYPDQTRVADGGDQVLIIPENAVQLEVATVHSKGDGNGPPDPIDVALSLGPSVLAGTTKTLPTSPWELTKDSKNMELKPLNTGPTQPAEIWVIRNRYDINKNREHDQLIWQSVRPLGESFGNQVLEPVRQHMPGGPSFRRSDLFTHVTMGKEDSIQTRVVVPGNQNSNDLLVLYDFPDPKIRHSVTVLVDDATEENTITPASEEGRFIVHNVSSGPHDLTFVSPTQKGQFFIAAPPPSIETSTFVNREVWTVSPNKPLSVGILKEDDDVLCRFIVHLPEDVHPERVTIRTYLEGGTAAYRPVATSQPTNGEIRFHLSPIPPMDTYSFMGTQHRNVRMYYLTYPLGKDIRPGRVRIRLEVEGAELAVRCEAGKVEG